MEKRDIRYTKFGWVDLSNLERHKKCYNWDASIGKTVDFEYQGIKATLKIKEKVSSQYVKIDVDGFVKNKIIYVGQIKHNRLGECVNVITARYKYNIGDIIGNLKLIGMSRQANDASKKYYRCRCLLDGYEWDLREDHLKNGHGCPVCANKVALKGINDIATTNPESVKYFVDIQDAYTHTFQSNKSVKLKCPNCGFEKMYKLNDFSTRGFSCPQCGDKVSYGNKYMFNFLKQLFPISEIKSEHRFKWSLCVPTRFQPTGKAMQYDIYLPMFNMIIENHGVQHYKECGLSKFISLEDTQENDRRKRQAAIDNGIYYYIEIDCSQSKSAYIKNSIMNSELPNVFGFTENDIDWDECDKYASGSLLIESAKIWNTNIQNAEEIAKQFGMHHSTISRYLRKARSLDLLTS